MTSKKLDDKIKLTARTVNVQIGQEVKVILKLYDENKKILKQKEYKEKVQENTNVEKRFTILSLSNESNIDSSKVKYVSGWIDADDDGEITREYEKEVWIEVIEGEEKITIIVELPHSKETGWGAKGLAGHTAMAIGNRFFDYGPDYSNNKIFNEEIYQADLNQDGDMEDNVKIDDIPNAGFYFAPGRPWWAEMISKEPKNVTLSQVLSFISSNWRNNNVYGTVYKIEFYIKKSQSNKILEWWKDRYKHLKIYSIKPWTGEQCTTTVKKALAYGGINNIDWDTLTPDGILEDLQTEIKSTSFQHKNEKAIITLIKKEAEDWNP
ncbi:hypothetical protein [Malaciobacter marinus]|uniref:hypothetical protein n=1 Tax=Malaciobacter marinus TaxID=505249 RepID=UPI003AFF7D53